MKAKKPVKSRTEVPAQKPEPVKPHVPPLMEHPFPKSTPVVEKLKKLLERLRRRHGSDSDQRHPDAMSSALALQRLFWRHVKKTWSFAST